MIFVSLDQSFNPYDISFDNTIFYECELDVPAGMGFTVIVNDGKGYGFDNPQQGLDKARPSRRNQERLRRTG